jgi:hypothetical protein
MHRDNFRELLQLEHDSGDVLMDGSGEREMARADVKLHLAEESSRRCCAVGVRHGSSL